MASVPSRPGNGPKPLDLTGRDRQLRAAMLTMNRVGVRFARAARRTLPFLVRRRAKLEPQPVSVAAPSPAPVDGPLFEVILESEGGSGWANLLLDSGALGLVLDSALGGREEAATAPSGELTLAERALVGRIARSLAEDFAAAIKDECGVEFTIASQRSIALGDRREEAGPDGLRVECRIEPVSGSPTVAITVGASVLEAAVREQEEHVPAAGDPRMAEAIRDVPVEVVAELGSVGLGLRRVLSLRVGQVLRLPTAVDDPVVLRVAGLRKFTGVPVVSRGQLSIEIRGRHGE
jgi:flagellar motor switch protein FliM